jgi:hypothetical protein
VISLNFASVGSCAGVIPFSDIHTLTRCSGPGPLLSLRLVLSVFPSAQYLILVGASAPHKTAGTAIERTVAPDYSMLWGTGVRRAIQNAWVIWVIYDIFVLCDAPSAISACQASSISPGCNAGSAPNEDARPAGAVLSCGPGNAPPTRTWRRDGF